MGVLIQGLFETHLTVRDLDTSVAFYRDVVGLELALLFPERNVAFFWIGGRGQAMLGVWEVGDGPNAMRLHFRARMRPGSNRMALAPRKASTSGVSDATTYSGYVCIVKRNALPPPKFHVNAYGKRDVNRRTSSTRPSAKKGAISKPTIASVNSAAPTPGTHPRNPIHFTASGCTKTPPIAVSSAAIGRWTIFDVT